MEKEGEIVVYDLKPGDKVRYVGCSSVQVRWGGHTDPRGVLENSVTYTVENVSVHSQHTRVYLVGFSGHFNSVCLEKVQAKEK